MTDLTDSTFSCHFITFHFPPASDSVLIYRPMHKTYLFILSCAGLEYMKSQI